MYGEKRRAGLKPATTVAGTIFVDQATGDTVHVHVIVNVPRPLCGVCSLSIYPAEEDHRLRTLASSFVSI
jgi:hypothetical protein